MNQTSNVVEPRSGWPLVPTVPEPAPKPAPEVSPTPESADEPVPVAVPVPPVDDLAAVMASLNTSTERVYLDRRPSAA